MKNNSSSDHKNLINKSPINKNLNKKNPTNILKWIAIAALVILVVSVIPLMILGRYNHALGDDFDYGQYAKIALDNGSFFSAIAEAAKGTANQYNIWQGTYSAMFLMHLPPQIFGDFFYKFYPTILIGTLVASVFVLMHPLIIKVMKAPAEMWLIISSVIAFVFVEQVPLMGETFYWYNGSMYYTGFFALTLIFFGLLIRFLLDEKIVYIAVLSLLGLFIAGANYASLIPSLIIMVLIIALLIIKKNSKKRIIGAAFITAFMLIGLAISVLAPGNSLRQDTSFGTSPVKAVLKSLLQAFNYLRGWNSVWMYLGLLLITPIFIMIIRRMNFDFKLPLLFCVFDFGILASASCPTFYAQNNGGAARVFDLSWYMLVLFVYSAWFYLLGWSVKHLKVNDRAMVIRGCSAVVLFFVLLSIFNPPHKSYIQLNSVQAIIAMANGDAASYEAQYQERVKMIESDEQDLVFTKYDVPDSLMYVLYLGDLSDNPSDLGNVAFANYYHKKSVRVKE